MAAEYILLWADFYSAPKYRSWVDKQNPFQLVFLHGFKRAFTFISVTTFDLSLRSMAGSSFHDSINVKTHAGQRLVSTKQHIALDRQAPHIKHKRWNLSIMRWGQNFPLFLPQFEANPPPPTRLRQQFPNPAVSFFETSPTFKSLLLLH